MKKLLCILLALAMLVSLIGCTSKVVEEIRTSQTTIGTEPTTVPEETTTTPTEPTEEELPPQIDQTDPPTTQPEPTEPPTTQPEPEPTVPPTTRPAPQPEPEPEPTVPPTTRPAPEPEPEPEPPTTQPEPEPEPEPEPTPQLDPDGSYTTKDDVALYLHLYGCLPKNFITKSEARSEYGWEKGSLEKKAPGKCLGGDRFYNKEGRLPADHTYYECDIDTLGSYASRGAKRIVYSDDGLIYYTDDHYETFTLLYSNFAVIDISALLFAVRFVY